MKISPILRAAMAMIAILTLAACGSSKKQETAAPQMQPQVMQQQVYQQQPQMMQQNAQIEQYRLGSGDEVRVTVFGEESINGAYKVDGAGMISLPLIGNVPAGNLTIPDLQARIAQQLSQGFLVNPRVSVQVMNYRPFFILGEVNRPNQYAYVEGMKVINAVAMAGGYTYRANEDNMYIVRGNDTTRVRQPAMPNTFVMPGDTIEIRERLF